MPKLTKKVSQKTAKNPLNQAIVALEKSRNSKVIVYITGDKKPEEFFSTKVASDVLGYFKQILQKINKTKKITLALYTNGGQLETPWPLVNMIREHCDEFEVVVMEKALSAGTMIALGSDRIIMNRYAHLSPIDPAADMPDGNNKLKHFEIEDIISYIDFVKEKIGLTEQNALCEIMKDLTREINPTMLGSANRTHSLVRRLAKNLLSKHKNQIPERQAKEIIENLTQKLFSHRHLINRKEAKEIGFEDIIEFPIQKDEKIINDLIDCYIKYLEIDKEFNPLELIGKDSKKDILINRAAIHSENLKFSFQSTYSISKMPDPTGAQQINVNVVNNKWVKI